MKKSLIALAVLAASGASMAQSNVTLYGVADMWFGSSKATATLGTVSSSARLTQLESGGVSTSRWGVKGSEDLGGGLKANFQLEQSIGLDTGTTGGGFDRQAWVGLSGGFGEVQLGRVWTSYDDIRASANDTFGANVASSFFTWNTYSDRTNNGIKYLTPVFGGFSGSVTYALGEDKNRSTNGKDNNLMALGVQYANGPLFVGFAHQTEKQGAITKLAVDPTGTFAHGSKATYNLLNASYDLGVVKLIGGVNMAKLTDSASTAYGKSNEFNLGVEAPLSPVINVAAGFSQSKTKNNLGPFSKATGFSAALTYSLSKRTMVYGALTQGKVKIESGIPLASTKTQLYAVGVQHKF
jgi:predicted porin